MNKLLQFPEGFVWGASTSAYQIEGAAHLDGRGESIWDRFCRKPGAVERGENGDEACRHYDYWRSDLALAHSLKLNSYRFSVAWPRIIPGGRGAVNTKGLDFYDRLVDEMLRLSLMPNLTLYHWDLPQALEDKGGWLNRDTAHAFADYAAVVARRLGDRVPMWATHNEPWCTARLGYESGIHAPGRRENAKSVNQVMHHLLLSHGLGMQVLRQLVPKAKAGIVLNLEVVLPNSGSVEDKQAAERRWRSENDWWLEPLFKGRYPLEVWQWKGADTPEVAAGDLELINQPMDFLGLNFYTPARVKAGDPSKGPLHVELVPKSPEAEGQAMPGWEVCPYIAEFLPLEIIRRWGRIPLYVTENGMALEDEAPDSQGRIHDARRISFLRRHLVHLHRAIDKGADVRGYYAWSLMDNFEWSFGYRLRFGLIHVNFSDSSRIPKDSAYCLKETAGRNAIEEKSSVLTGI